MSHFVNTVRQILACDSVGPLRGITGHLGWQLRKSFGLFPCELTIGNSRLYVDRPGGVAALVNAMGEYDYNNMELLKLVLRQKPSAFIDVGANIGSYTLIASEIPGTVVMSIEPHPLTFESLKENVRRNSRTNVACVNIAVSRNDSDIRLSDGNEPALNRVLADDERTDREFVVKGRRLEGVCIELGVVPDVIKIDVEGYEDAVLAGLGIFKRSACMIFIEGGERLEVRSWMHESGYSGPWFVHFGSRALSGFPQKRPEDPVFIQRRWVSLLRQLEFNLTSELIRS